MKFPLGHLSKNGGTPPSSDQVLDEFLSYVQNRGLELYPAQEEAILELLDGKNVILNTPTGSGKSLVAAALHFASLAAGRRSVYTCPIKALVNEKFLALCRDFGPENVGMATGDATVNPGAPILCCTAEILSSRALREGRETQVDDVIMDEFHYYSDRERGVAWQIPLLTMPQARFLLMSATLGDTERFEKGLTALNARPTVVIRSGDRPVPLEYEYSETPLHEVIGNLVARGRAPIYLVNFSQREAAEQAQNLLSVDFCTKDEKKTILAALEGASFKSPYGKELQRFLKHGIGLHHAGLLPRYRVLVEGLAQKGLLKVISGTDTLGVGVNVPIRTVLLTKLCKFDGEKTSLLSVRDFQQIAGRAGRKGFDDLGTVVAQAPEHVIENVSMERKAAGDPKKLKKIVKRKPPDKGFVAYNEDTFRKLVSGTPEPLQSRFKMNHGVVLSVLSRKRPHHPGRPAKDLHRLIRDSHEPDGTKRRIGRQAFALFRSLVDRKIIELNPMRVNVELQEDFSLNHALSLYLLDTLTVLDPQSPDYALDALSLVESILENPEVVLRKQVDRAKTEKMAELKAQGMEFDQRIEELDKVEYPKPQSEFIYSTFNAFVAAHPWVEGDGASANIRPKSVAREMYEGFASFADYVRDYGLERSEGVLLRYLSEVYKVLAQTVPDTVKDAAPGDSLRELEDFFRGLIKATDSSLLEEWERLKDPNRAIQAVVAGPEPVRGPDDLTRHPKLLEIRVRNESFALVRALARGDVETLVGHSSSALLASGVPTTAAEWETLGKKYHEDHGRIQTDTKARAPQFLKVERSPERWRLEQVVTDIEGHNDWLLTMEVDLAQVRETGEVVPRIVHFGPIGSA